MIDDVEDVQALFDLRGLVNLLTRELQPRINPLQDLLLADERSLVARVVAVLPAAQKALGRLENVLNAFDHERSVWAMERDGLQARKEFLEAEVTRLRAL